MSTTAATTSRAPACSVPASVNPGRTFSSWQLPKMGYSVFGYSRCRDKTFLHMPELNLALDAGLCQGRQPATVFLTHTHADHATDIAYLSRRAQGSAIYCPKETVGHIQKFIEAEVELNNCSEYDYAFASHELHGVEDGDTFEFSSGAKKATPLVVKVVKCVHAVPCVGYAVSQRKKSLKKEFAGLPGKEIAAKRKAGVDVTEEVLSPQFVYMGDTHPSAFDVNPWLLDYPVVITECTFPFDEPGLEERAARDGHTTWAALRPYVLSHPKTTFLLIHFSLRYSVEEIREHFQSMTEPNAAGEAGLDLGNVVLFLGEHHHGKK